MIKKDYQLTLAGKKELEDELRELKGRRSEIADKIATARDFGDLSENSEYSAAKDEQSQVENRIAEVENILQNSTLIKAKSTSKVQLGNTVTLKTDGKTVVYTVVGSVEADPLEGKISDESPIGQALLGRKVGDTVTIDTPRGAMVYEVVSIA